MPEALSWQITVTPTPDGYSLRETSGDSLSEAVCSEVASVLTEALNDYLDN